MKIKKKGKHNVKYKRSKHNKKNNLTSLNT